MSGGLELLGLSAAVHPSSRRLCTANTPTERQRERETVRMATRVHNFVLFYGTPWTMAVYHVCTNIKIVLFNLPKRNEQRFCASTYAKQRRLQQPRSLLRQIYNWVNILHMVYIGTPPSIANFLRPYLLRKCVPACCARVYRHRRRRRAFILLCLQPRFAFVFRKQAAVFGHDLKPPNADSNSSSSIITVCGGVDSARSARRFALLCGRNQPYPARERSVAIARHNNRSSLHRLRPPWRRASVVWLRCVTAALVFVFAQPFADTSETHKHTHTNK